MIPYRHFALSNLYLVNGYREFETAHGLAREYERESELENCVRRLLLRTPVRLRGWDLRFLRRGLGLAQSDFGKMIDRDAQTVARWEKTTDEVPASVDLMIRARFAERFEPTLSLAELLSFVDGKGPKLPERILLTYTDAG